jgi:hypothetical protein
VDKVDLAVAAVEETAAEVVMVDRGETLDMLDLLDQEEAMAEGDLGVAEEETVETVEMLAQQAAIVLVS